ncbi:phosphoribosylglycinamide formyltransferase [Methanomicrobiaceae archaeon CYW5]|uniref:phosphoribosylglycinamide formyltransferase n=1 Tax=Methanovulcanius yangii TaxID=1789227 RepID=UPI0029C9D4F4|nr:phosphoribosylglycinamide formyltransferase [Methanovulcanius yangii]MBT8507135.1 phosphoribosylglycinamide formyltransferase [Methanovulcanius yangii]
MKRIAVLASGNGSNFQAIIERVRDGAIPGRIIRLITDNPGAYAIERAGRAGIEVRVIDFRSFDSRSDYDRVLEQAMDETRADLFVLAGYMRLLNDKTAAKFAGKMINIHPSLLPSFAGLHAQRQAIEYGVKVAGCTVHFVDEEMDSGPIIIQRVVDVAETDDEDSLAQKIMIHEHQALPYAVQLFCEDRLRINGRQVQILKDAE